MAVVCNTREFIIQLVPGYTTYYYYWDKIDKVMRQGFFSSVTDYYQLSAGSIIDVIQSGGQVFLVIKSASAPFYDFIQLYSTSGAPYNTLVSAVVVGDTLTVTMQNFEETILTFPMQVFTTDSPAIAIVPCFTNYYGTPGTIINQWCDGFTLHQIIVNGSGGVNEVETANSVTCGYSVPFVDFRFSEEIEIHFENRCFINPVYFVWKNTLGGWDYWLFETNQTRTLNTESLGAFVKNYTKIGDINNPKTTRGKKAIPTVVYGAEDLDHQQKTAIEQILYSNKVYIINADGTVNREVEVLAGSATPDRTEGNKFAIEFEIEDVQINTIRN